MLDNRMVKSIFAIAVLLLLIVSCAGTNQVEDGSQLSEWGQDGNEQDVEINANSNRMSDDAAPDYYLKSGDAIDVKFYYSPSLNDSMTIRPDGKITLQLVGEVHADGLTPMELDKTLTEKYSGVLRDPEVAVIVRRFSEYKVYVTGEVKAPRVIPMTGQMTVLRAIASVGGFAPTAKTKNVIIIRKGAKYGRPEYLKVDLNSILSGDDDSNDILLKPFDVVYVPESTIAKVNKFIRQYINQAIPQVPLQLYRDFAWLDLSRQAMDQDKDQDPSTPN